MVQNKTNKQNPRGNGARGKSASCRRRNAVTKPPTNSQNSTTSKSNVQELVKLINEQKKALDDMLTKIGGMGDSESPEKLSPIHDLHTVFLVEKPPRQATADEIRKIDGIAWLVGSDLDGVAGVTRHKKALVNLRKTYKVFQQGRVLHHCRIIGDLPLGNGSHIKDIHVFPKLAPECNVLQATAVQKQDNSLVLKRGSREEVALAGTEVDPIKFTVIHKKDSALDYVAIPVLNDAKFNTVQGYKSHHGIKSDKDSAQIGVITQLRKH